MKLTPQQEKVALTATEHTVVLLQYKEDQIAFSNLFCAHLFTAHSTRQQVSQRTPSITESSLAEA